METIKTTKSFVIITIIAIFAGFLCGTFINSSRVNKELEEATITASILSDVVRIAMDNGDDCVEEIYYTYTENLDSYKIPLDSINLNKYVWGY